MSSTSDDAPLYLAVFIFIILPMCTYSGNNKPVDKQPKPAVQKTVDDKPPVEKSVKTEVPDE